MIDGPFTESKELIAGCWVWECSSREEAIDWLKRAPFDGGVELELRQIQEDDDFGDELTPELRAAEARMREADRPGLTRWRPRRPSARSTPPGGSSRPGWSPG